IPSLERRGGRVETESAAGLGGPVARDAVLGQDRLDVARVVDRRRVAGPRGGGDSEQGRDEGGRPAHVRGGPQAIARRDLLKGSYQDSPGPRLDASAFRLVIAGSGRVG